MPKPKKSKSKANQKRKPAKLAARPKRQPKEDFNQIAYKAVQETIRKSIFRRLARTSVEFLRASLPAVPLDILRILAAVPPDTHKPLCHLEA